MTYLDRKILYILKKYQQLLLQLEKLDNFPEGSLQVKNRSNRYEFFHYVDKNKRYIGKDKDDLKLALANKEYIHRLQRKIRDNLKLLEKIHKNFRERELDDVYYRLHEAKRALIEPIERTWEMMVSDWKNQKYPKKRFMDNTAEIITKSGVRVRSKSEKILADYFDEKGIEFLYEKPIYIDEFTIFHPDFTFLSPITKKEIFWEHFGMMDNPTYLANAYKKLMKYRTCGIYLGINLIVTFENSKQFINMKEVEALVEHFLID